MRDITTTQGGRIAIALEGGLSITRIGRDFSTEEWCEMLNVVSGAPMPPKVSLVFVDEGADVTAEHRRLAAANTKGDPVLAVALITTSRLARGAMTAYSWLMPGRTKYRAFEPKDQAEALAWLMLVAPFDLARATALAQTIATHSAQAPRPQVR